MAKKAKFEFDDALIAKAVKPIKYFSKHLRQSFDYQAVDKDGNAKIKMNNQGMPIYDNEGNTQPIHLHATFTAISERAKEGYVSVYVFDPSDDSPQNKIIGEELEKLAAARNEKVMSEDAFDMSTNAAMFAEKKRAREIEQERDMYKAEVERLKSPEELQRKLDELTLGK